MTTSLKGNRKKLQNLIATIVEDGFYEACRTFEKAGLDESDFHNNWLEVIPVLFGVSFKSCV